MIMMKAVFRRFLAILICLLICVSGSTAEDISVILKPDADTWTNGEAFTFSGEVRHPGTDLSDAIIQMVIETDPDEEDKGQLVFTSINGVDEDPDWWDSELWLGEYETNGDLLRFTGTWTVPEGSKFNKAKLTVYLIRGDRTTSTASCEMENAHPEINLYGLSVLQLALILLAIIALITGIWFLLHRKKEQTEVIVRDHGWRDRLLDTVIILLFFLGVIITPIMVRTPFIYRMFRSMGSLCYLNYPCTLALLLSFLRLKKWTKTDLLFFAAWLLLLIPMCVSNRELEYTKYVLAAFQNLLPVYFVFYRMNERTREKTIRLFMILFNTFIFILLAFAIEEKITNKAVIKAFRDWLVERNLYAQDFIRFTNDKRFFSFWGHPLTNALLFNGFLTLNTAWYKSRGKTIRALFYYPFAMAGVLLSGSKTGITVCLLMLIVICWDYKKWLLLCIPIFAALYFSGAFNHIIYRFTHTSLTTGRLEALEMYFGKIYSEYPFQWLHGYGSNVAMIPGLSVYKVRAGFEFPLLMAALDHGIIFSVVLMAGSYLYITRRCLKKRQWVIWLCFTLFFAEVNTYNGYTLRNQDICTICYFVAMIMLNMLPDKTPKKGKETETEKETESESVKEPAGPKEEPETIQ